MREDSAALTWDLRLHLTLDRLAPLGLMVLTISGYGILARREVATCLHAASTVGLIRVLPIVLASVVGGEPAALARAVLVGAFLTVTTPVVAHEIGRAAHFGHEPMAGPDGRDGSESSRPTQL